VRARSVTVRDSPAEVSATDGVGLVLTVLPDAASLEEVFLGPAGLLRAPGGIRPSLFVNVSTVDPDTARRLAAEVRAAPLAAPAPGRAAAALLDAPATGGVPGAESGELVFCVGADDAADIEAARPTLELLGRRIAHCGPVGAGSVAKLVRAPCLARPPRGSTGGAEGEGRGRPAGAGRGTAWPRHPWLPPRFAPPLCSRASESVPACSAAPASPWPLYPALALPTSLRGTPRPLPPSQPPPPTFHRGPQCNALVMSASMTAVSEALALGKRMGVDPAVLTDVLQSGSGRRVCVGVLCLRSV
jgi:3-hydroxyisobutyrate dehydrogenase-like beta-hydroxyacid dehydrogenase